MHILKEDEWIDSVGGGSTLMSVYKRQNPWKILNSTYYATFCCFCAVLSILCQVIGKYIFSICAWLSGGH